MYFIVYNLKGKDHIRRNIIDSKENKMFSYM